MPVPSSERAVHERRAVADQKLAVARHRHEVGHRSDSATATAVAACCAQSPIASGAARALSVAVDVADEAVAVDRDEIQPLVGFIRCPAPTRIQSARLGELFAKLVDFTGARESRVRR